VIATRLTLWVLVVSLLQVLDDTLLADKLFNLALCFDVEGILIEQGDLVLALALGILSRLLPHSECLSPAVGVVNGGEELRVALPQLALGLGVHKELLSHALWVGLAHARGVVGALGLLLLHRLPVLADEHGQHLAILDTGTLQGLCLLGDRLAVEVDAL
jgi:hypothetical protein